METTGDIEIRVIGKKGNLDLKPENYDIKDIVGILHNIEDLLYPNNRKGRPIITYDIKEGSVRHIFKTSLQYVIAASAVLAQIQEEKSIGFLDGKTAEAIQNIQKISQERGYEFQFKTSVNKNKGIELSINPNTKFLKADMTWVDAEFYFYGTLKDAGGKIKSNIHIDTDDFGYLTIETGQDFLMRREDNLLYKKYGVRATGKQNLETGEFKSLKLIDLIDYDANFDSDYLTSLISKAKKSWQGVDTDKWLENLRGDYEL